MPDTPASQPCRICNHAGPHATYAAREMMFGLRDLFNYVECAGCGCVQIAAIPGDMGKYYPGDYYSFAPVTDAPVSPLKDPLKRARTQYAIHGEGWPGRWLTMLTGEARVPAWAKAARLKTDARILDVGCGAGQLLVSLRGMGFVNLTGVDPFIREDIRYPSGVRIVKGELAGLGGGFDCIMLHHSFEHMADPQAILHAAHRKLSPGGRVLVRIPVAGSYAWREYKTDWVQLDAPRHFYLHTVKSMERLARDAGFEVASVEYDSEAFQILGSEQYRRDIPLMDPRSYLKDRGQSIFTEAEIRDAGAMAKELNAKGDGDQACFLLRRRAG